MLQKAKPMAISLLVKGERAMFTRPELKAERYTYPFMTPSAAEGLMRAIYWHPGTRYKIDRITVLNRIRYDRIRTNEVSTKAKIGRLNALANGKTYFIAAGTPEERTQRSTTFLRDVAYIIDAHIEIENEGLPEAPTPEKAWNIFVRRASKGQCYTMPYLGIREYGADVMLLEPGMVRPESYYKGTGEIDHGFILKGIEWNKDKVVTGVEFFHAIMVDGVIEINK